MVSHENGVNEPEVRVKAHNPRVKSPKDSRPYLLDWVLQYQIGVLLLRCLNRNVYLIDCYRDSFDFDRGCSLTAHSLSPVPTLHTEIFATILPITDGPNIQAGLR